MAVHLFVDATGAHDGDATLAQAVRVLDGEEIARLHGFAFEADRWRYAAAHLLLRRALTRLHPHREVQGWRFERGAHGRPRLHASHPESVSFSLTHTEDAIACVVADASLEVGVDAESLSRAAPLELAAAKFTAAEQANLAALDGAAREHAFYELWTLKEAYLKARGIGLALPLDAIAIARGDPPRLSLASIAGDDAERWTLALRRRGRAIVAVAIGRRTRGCAVPELVEHGA